MSKPRVSAKVRQQVKVRAHHLCEYCRSLEEYSPTRFSVEHIIPYSRNGTNALDNLAHSCQECNNEKSTHIEAIDPLTGNIVPLYDPCRHIWAEHFRWSDDTLHIIGISPSGRATTELLRLNRQSVVNLRSVLILIGKHPPESGME